MAELLFKIENVAIPGKMKINGETISTYKTTFYNHNVLEAKVGTTGYNDRHHSYTIIELADQGGTQIKAIPFKNKCGDNGIKIILKGESEITTLIQSLEFFLEVLKKQAK